MLVNLIELEQVSVSRPAVGTVLANLTWTLRDGETWAIVGPTASGKSTLAQVLAGQLRIDQGTLTWPIVSLAGKRYPHEAIRLVGFREESRLFHYGGLYYQQRFEFADTEAPLSLAEFLHAGSPVTPEEVRTAAAKLGLESHLELAFLKLSNGQTRRARIARGLLARPALLILDEPFTGIDAEGRDELAALLGTLVQAGQRLLLVTNGDVPPWVTHTQRMASPTTSTTQPAGPVLAPSPLPGPPVLELHNVTVRHSGRIILDRVSWTVRAGERWALIGPNGAGKTTLLALACGDHPQAFSNEVKLFGQRRGTGETIWDVKRRVGFVSPEFHVYFSEPLTGFEAASTGFHDTLLYREPTPQQAEAVRARFAEWGIAALLDRPFRQLSTGQQRLVLLVRAVVKQPELLILDEPFQGLDTATASRIRDWLDAKILPQQTLIFTTHIPSEIPRCVRHDLRLEAGRVSS